MLKELKETNPLIYDLVRNILLGISKSVKEMIKETKGLYSMHKIDGGD